MVCGSCSTKLLSFAACMVRMRFWNKDGCLKRAAAIPNHIEKVLLIKLTSLFSKTLTGIFVTGHHGPTEVGLVLVFNPVSNSKVILITLIHRVILVRND